MQTSDVIDITRDAIWLTLKIGMPLLLVALVVGLLVSLFQALTQIQEMTLAFIPKIMAVFGTLLISLPFMVDALNDFTVELFNRMATM